MNIESPIDLAPFIDHTALKAVTTNDEIERLCKEAKEYGFCSVCVNPYYVPLAVKKLEGSNVKICTVIGFPLGATSGTVKAFETKKACQEGAEEIDMVLNISAMKSGDYDIVKNDIMAVVNAASKGVIVKVILETCYLNDEEIVKATKLAVEGGADFIKTSTGFGTCGAKTEHVEIMKRTAGADVEVKASGGIKGFESAKSMIDAGATRLGIGSSSVISIISGKTSEENY